MVVVERGWAKLAPKLIAFLASGLTVSGVIAVLHIVGIDLNPGIATFAVGAIATVAAYIQRDNLLSLPWSVLAPKVLIFGLSSVTVTGLVTLLSFFHYNLDPALAGLVVTVIGGVLAFFRTDVTATSLPK